MSNKAEKPTPEVDISELTFDDDDNFFGIKDLSDEKSGVPVMQQASPKKEEPPEDDPDEEKEKPKPKPKPKEDEEEEEPFKAPKKPTKKEPEDEPEEGVAVDAQLPEDFYTNLALDMRDMGILSDDLKIDDKNPIALEDFMELQSKEIENRVNEEFEAFAEDMDADGKAFIAFKRKGGNTNDFLNRYLAPSFNLQNFEEDNTNHIAYVIDHYLRTVERLDGEELEDRKAYIKESGKEKERATKYFNKLKKADEDRKAAIMDAVEQRAIAAEKEATDFNNDLRDIVEKNNKINNFSITKEDKKSLVDFMSLPAVKIGKNKYVPQFQSEIRRILTGATDKDKKDLLLLAKIIRAKFDTKDMLVSAETEITKEIKSRLAHKSNGVRATSATGRKIKELADEWDE